MPREGGRGKAVIRVNAGLFSAFYILPAPENANFLGVILHDSLRANGFDSIEATETGFRLRSQKSPLTSQVNLLPPAVDNQLNEIPPLDFQIPPSVDQPDAVLINTGKAFRNYADSVASNVSADESLPSLMHVMAEVKNGKMALVSTDGHRLTRIQVPKKRRGDNTLQRIYQIRR
jgi:hypothetical protein